MKRLSGMVFARGDVHPHSFEKNSVERPDGRAVAGEREAVTHDRPQDGNQKRRGETLRHRCEHVLLAHHAGVKQCKTRDGHHQHETGRTDHPGGVGAIDLCVLCEGG
jgi:hypothetical protein